MPIFSLNQEEKRWLVLLGVSPNSAKDSVLLTENLNRIWISKLSRKEKVTAINNIYKIIRNYYVNGTFFKYSSVWIKPFSKVKGRLHYPLFLDKVLVPRNKVDTQWILTVAGKARELNLYPEVDVSSITKKLSSLEERNVFSLTEELSTV
jgi:hypothetical protein